MSDGKGVGGAEAPDPDWEQVCDVHDCSIIMRSVLFLQLSLSSKSDTQEKSYLFFLSHRHKVGVCVIMVRESCLSYLLLIIF